jgi:hypothetical protein
MWRVCVLALKFKSDESEAHWGSRAVRKKVYGNTTFAYPFIPRSHCLV